MEITFFFVSPSPSFATIPNPAEKKLHRLNPIQQLERHGGREYCTMMFSCELRNTMGEEVDKARDDNVDGELTFEAMTFISGLRQWNFLDETCSTRKLIALNI